MDKIEGTRRNLKPGLIEYFLPYGCCFSQLVVATLVLCLIPAAILAVFKPGSFLSSWLTCSSVIIFSFLLVVTIEGLPNWQRWQKARRSEIWVKVRWTWEADDDESFEEIWEDSEGWRKDEILSFSPEDDTTAIVFYEHSPQPFKPLLRTIQYWENHEVAGTVEWLQPREAVARIRFEENVPPFDYSVEGTKFYLHSNPGWRGEGIVIAPHSAK